MFQLCGALPIHLPKPLNPTQRPQMLYARLLLEALDDATLDVVAAQVRVITQHAKRRRAG